MVYCTGRTTSRHRSDYNRPETIEETADLVSAAGGTGIAVAVDHRVGCPRWKPWSGGSTRNRAGWISW